MCNGDLYKNPKSIGLRTEDKSLRGEVAFKPAKNVKDLYCMKSSYEHKADRVDISKNYRNEDGAVAIGPRNILTNPPKVGEVGKQTSFGGNLPHMPDDYDNHKKLALKEYQEHKKKVQEKPFS